MDRVHLPQGYGRATARRQFTFYHYVSRNSRYSFDRTRKDGKPQSTFKPLIGLEHGALGLVNQHLNHYAISVRGSHN